MRFSVERAMEGDLYDPILGGSLGPIKEQGFLVQVKESLLDNIFGFTAVPYDTPGDSEYQASVSMKEGLQGARITGLETCHEFFIAGDAMVGHVRGMDGLGLGTTRYDWKSKRASRRPRTHR